MKKYVIYLNDELYERDFVYADNEKEICKNLAEMLNEDEVDYNNLILSGYDFMLGIKIKDAKEFDKFIEDNGTYFEMNIDEFKNSEIYNEICDKEYKYYNFDELTDVIDTNDTEIDNPYDYIKSLNK